MDDLAHAIVREAHERLGSDDKIQRYATDPVNYDVYAASAAAKSVVLQDHDAALYMAGKAVDYSERCWRARFDRAIA